ncbi:SAG-related sequence [Besnoitia besnoiti]|uniref:SAG-related sequence n=1 Tax=Besnoitia besnoiti TaxID=94643 RepID=A0A2A9M721_BESBE|nr:SAG-related sequence [Besnoitia besnoiti]PFH33749.1 SAG-related sequence [Besnoitia besnoiti]
MKALSWAREQVRRRPRVGLGAAGVVFAVILTLHARVIRASAQQLESESPPLCKDGEGIQVRLSEKLSSAQFKCQPGKIILPPLRGEETRGNNKVFSGFLDAEGKIPIPFPPTGFTIENTTGETYTLKASSFPQHSGIWYLFCDTKSEVKQTDQADATVKCPITVVIEGTSKDPQCIRMNGTTDLQVEGAGGSVTFGCGYNFPRLDPGLPSTDVYVGRECDSKQKLSTLAPGAELTNKEGSQLYTLAAPTLPQSEQTLCYQCRGESNARFASCVAAEDQPAAAIGLLESMLVNRMWTVGPQKLEPAFLSPVQTDTF